MSQEAERVYTINLGKVWLSPDNQRAKRAINMIREFAEHHMKTEQIKIDQELSQQVWKRGIRSPPRKIRVKMAKTEDGYVMVSPYEEESAKPKAEEKPKKSEKKSESKEEPEAKAETKAKPEPKAEEKPKEKKSDTKKKPAAKKPAKKSK
ncbi:MAG: 60S ribosomal protein L31 [Thaumarchaeota archaeon]|nr:60S ribosomal protein L31 [Nitrososphaerota archaeon]